MPASNPIVAGKHIASYSNVASGFDESEGAPMYGGAGGGNYHVPAAFIIALALVIALLLAWGGFAFVVAAKISA